MRLTMLGCFTLLALAGCSDVAQQDVTAAAVSFLDAEPAQACRLLAPDTARAVAERADGSCARGLTAVDRPAGGTVLAVELAGQSAQVRLATDVLFLARFPDGWRVTAAACERDDPDREVPYRCEVEP